MQPSMADFGVKPGPSYQFFPPAFDVEYWVDECGNEDSLRPNDFCPSLTNKAGNKLITGKFD